MLGIITRYKLVRFWPVLASPTHSLGFAELALRVVPAVTSLTVYRWLHIPVRVVFAQRRIHNDVGAGDL